MKIRPKLILAFSLSMVTVAIILGSISYYKANNALTEVVESKLLTKATDTVVYVEEKINEELTILEMLASLEDIQSMEPEKQRRIISTFVEGKEDLLSLLVIDNNEQVITTSDDSFLDSFAKDVSQKGLSGETFISDVHIDTKLNQPVMYATMPIKKGEAIQGTLLARLDGRFLSKVAQEINIGETGYSFITNQEGVAVGHANEEFVIEQVNFVQIAKEDAEYEELANLLTTMGTGETGVLKYYFQGEERIAAYAPIHGTDWSVGVAVFQSEALEKIFSLRTVVFTATIILLIAGIAIAFFLGGQLANPLIVVERLGLIVADGDFTNDVPERLLRRKDEVGSIAQAIDSITRNMRDIVSQITSNAHSVASQSEQLTTVTEQSIEAANDVAQSIQEVAEASETQVLSSEESVEAIVEMSKGVQRIADTAIELSEFSNHTTEKSRLGAESVQLAIKQMSNIHEGSNETTELINHLKESSEQVGEIVKLITAISEQTNLLALNAAIEAARAGDAGRGFAVVANEIRILSEQTANSTQEINTLIHEIQSEVSEAVTSVHGAQNEIKKGNSTLQTVGEAFNEILTLIEQVNEQVEDLSAVSEEMSASSEEVSASIEEMANKAKQSSANAQQVAAASEEQLATIDDINSTAEALESMAQELSDLANQFKI